MNLDDAVAQLEVEVNLLKRAKEGTTEWWVLLAKSTGLSMLKKFKQDKLTEMQADTFRKIVRRDLMKLEDVDGD